MQFTTIPDPLNPTHSSNDLPCDCLTRADTDLPQEMLRTTMLHAVLKGSTPLPAATRADTKVMHHLATLMHSSGSCGRGISATLLPGCLFLKTPGLIVHATASRRPLYLAEMEVVAIATGHPVVLLRRSFDEASPDLTVDVALPSPADLIWLLDYRLFRGLAGDSWLVAHGAGPSIRLMRHGLFLSDQAPYVDHWGCDAGLDRASVHLASHRIGGWSW